MESIRPTQSEPIPVGAPDRTSAAHLGKTIVRFAALLFIAITVLVLLWTKS